MSMASVQCSRCSMHKKDTPESNGDYYCCAFYHFLCSNCMRRNKMSCPICHATVKLIRVLDPPSASSQSPSKANISSMPLEENNKLMDHIPEQQVRLEKHVIEIKVREVVRLVPVDEKHDEEQTAKIRDMKAIECSHQPENITVAKKDASQQTTFDKDEPALTECYSTEVEKKQISSLKPINSDQLCEIRQIASEKAKEPDTSKDNTNTKKPNNTAEIKMPIETKKQASKQIVENKDVLLQTSSDEDKQALAECDSTEVERNQMSYSNPIHSDQLCGIRQIANAKAKEPNASEETSKMEGIMAEIRMPIEQKKQASKHIVEKKDEKALAECVSAAVERKQMSYSKPIYSRQLCEMEQNMNDKAKELDTSKDNTNTKKQDITAVMKLPCLQKLSEALQEPSGTLELQCKKPKPTRLPAPTSPTVSPRAHKALCPATELKNTSLKEAEEKLVNIYAYKCMAAVPENAAPDEPRMIPLSVLKSAYQPTGKTYMTDALAGGIPLIVNRVPLFCPFAKCAELTSPRMVVHHFKCKHPNVSRESIKVGQLMNFTIDACHYGKKHRCAAAMMYVLNDLDFKLGTKSYSDNSLQIFVLVRPTDQAKVLDDAEPNLKSQEFLQVWLAGVVPEKVVIQGTLMLVDDDCKGCGTCSISTSVYSLRQPQDPRSIFKSGKSMMIQRKLVERMTNNFQEPLKFQLILK